MRKKARPRTHGFGSRLRLGRRKTDVPRTSCAPSPALFMPANNAFAGICSCVTACTGRFASFFVNIGRADTLGSGMRNLYKYTKLYSNAEPILSEGDVFEMRIPLKKSVVGTKKSVVDTEKSVIQTKKITLEQLLEECKRRSYNITVVNNLKKIHFSALSCNMNVHMYIESLRGECYHHILRIDFQR